MFMKSWITHSFHSKSVFVNIIMLLIHVWLKSSVIAMEIYSKSMFSSVRQRNSLTCSNSTTNQYIALQT
ncbi:unnamed protein product [Schistosoma turkestanicum]|nr:unnamed protein product [Schistosoma turkestanicum]